MGSVPMLRRQIGAAHLSGRPRYSSADTEPTYPRAKPPREPPFKLAFFIRLSY
jgi:hypothetical protein